MLCFKYSTRIPLIHDASIMAFPLLEWCGRLRSALLACSLSLSDRKVRGREGEKDHRSMTKTTFVVQRTSIQGQVQEPAEDPKMLCACGTTSRLASWQHRAGLQPATEYRGLVSGNSSSACICFYFMCLGRSRLILRDLSTRVEGTLTGCSKTQV